MKKCLIALVIIAIGSWGYYSINANFSVSHITLEVWPENTAASLNSPEEIQKAKSILKQPFTYLAQGRQSFIFESSDGKYVIKFMKCQRINPAKWYEFFSDCRQERTLRFERLAKSMSLAKNPLQEQTGVLLLHVHPSNEIEQSLQLIDRLGISYTVDINKCPFVLQKKAIGAFSTLKTLYKENKIQELKARLNQLLDLFVERASYGISNPDGKLIGHNNVGFLDTRAVYIDIGTLRLSPKSTDQSYLEKDFKRLDPILHWLQLNDRGLSASFSNEIEDAKKRILASHTDSSNININYIDTLEI
jgi:hypothetical protein